MKSPGGEESGIIREQNVRPQIEFDGLDEDALQVIVQLRIKQ